MTRIRSRELRPGDVVEDHGQSHRVARVDRRAGWAWPVASDDAGWAIALGDAVVDVRRSA